MQPRPSPPSVAAEVKAEKKRVTYERQRSDQLCPEAKEKIANLGARLSGAGFR